MDENRDSLKIPAEQDSDLNPRGKRHGYRCALIHAGLQIGLVLISAGLLSLAFAPFNQFYLAWIGLAPFLIMVARGRSQTGVFLYAFIGGWVFNLLNLYWLVSVTHAGAYVLEMYCACYWGFAALICRGIGIFSWRRTWLVVLAVPAIWTGGEWLRGNFLSGFPWLYLGHTQSPAPLLCQIADITGVYGISFFVVMVSTLVALAVLHFRRASALILPATITAIFAAALLIYGAICLAPIPPAKDGPAGPVVALIQANYPQSNDGSKGASETQRFIDHLKLSTQAVNANPGKIDLLAWSETMLPAINAEALRYSQSAGTIVADLKSEMLGHMDLIAGAEYAGDFRPIPDEPGNFWPHDRHNSAYLFDRNGQMIDTDSGRYDKVHLVPFGEYIPFKESAPWLYQQLLKLGPNRYADYQLSPGSIDRLTTFSIQRGRYRIGTPICFEDVDSSICSRLCWKNDQKNVDGLLNLTNDGWFRKGENAQHLQIAVFRAIENRVPLARCVNTGISAFIDSDGRITAQLPVRTDGTLVGQMVIDPRVTFYMRHGDLFGGLCVLVFLTSAGFGVVRRIRRRTAHYLTASAVAADEPNRSLPDRDDP